MGEKGNEERAARAKKVFKQTETVTGKFQSDATADPLSKNYYLSDAFNTNKTITGLVELGEEAFYYCSGIDQNSVRYQGQNKTDAIKNNLFGLT